MKKLLAAALAAVAAAAAALAIPALAAGTQTVALKDTFFAPKSMTIARGATIKFRWVGQLPHNVTVRRGPQRFRTPNFTHGHTLLHRFTVSGRYLIVCTIHPGMELNLRVK
jgi:plastocyanin